MVQKWKRGGTFPVGAVNPEVDYTHALRPYQHQDNGAARQILVILIFLLAPRALQIPILVPLKTETRHHSLRFSTLPA